MPCEQCNDENYKWGKTGSCKYATKEECEEANKDYYKQNNTTMKQYPTPLGKTYEEYEKELKEYKLSSQRIELNDVKTIEKLIGQVDKQTEQLKKLAATTTEKFKALKVVDDAYAALDEQREKIDAEQMKLGNKYEKLESAWSQARNKMNDANTITQTRNLKEAMENVEAMAKELGIGKVPIVAKGQKALDRQLKIDNVVDKAYSLTPR